MVHPNINVSPILLKNDQFSAAVYNNTRMNWEVKSLMKNTLDTRTQTSSSLSFSCQTCPLPVVPTNVYPWRWNSCPIERAWLPIRAEERTGSSSIFEFDKLGWVYRDKMNAISLSHWSSNHYMIVKEFDCVLCPRIHKTVGQERATKINFKTYRTTSTFFPRKTFVLLGQRAESFHTTKHNVYNKQAKIKSPQEKGGSKTQWGHIRVCELKFACFESEF